MKGLWPLIIWTGALRLTLFGAPQWMKLQTNQGNQSGEFPVGKEALACNAWTR